MTISLLGTAAKAVTAAAGATSITPTYSSATTAGNLLVLAVCVTGTNPFITTPAGWSVGQYSANSTVVLGVYYRAQNPGGITAVAVTVGGPTQGVVASVYEFSNGVTNQAQLLSANYSANGTGTAVASLTPSAGVQYTRGLFLYAVGRAAATLTPTFDIFYAWSASQQAAVSTAGVPNAQMDFYWLESSGYGPAPTASGTLGASVSFAQVNIMFVTTDSSIVNGTNVGGVSGIYVPTFHQGMTGG